MSVEPGLSLANAMSNGSEIANSPGVSGKRKRGNLEDQEEDQEAQDAESHLAKRQSVGVNSPRSAGYAGTLPDEYLPHPHPNAFSPSNHQAGFNSGHNQESVSQFYGQLSSNGQERSSTSAPSPNHLNGTSNSVGITSATSQVPYPAMSNLSPSHTFSPPDRPLPSNQYPDQQGELPGEFSMLDSGQGEKPHPGTDEWHRLRKDNHKEVERRRRETINEGINELAKIVPNCDKNKGSILASAVTYIGHLKEKDIKSQEAWSLEKMLAQQAISELSQHVTTLKQERDTIIRERDTALQERELALQEAEQWKNAGQTADMSDQKEPLPSSTGPSSTEYQPVEDRADEMEERSAT